MSDDRKYVRVYYSIVNDERFANVYHDARHLGTWLQLLMVADAMYPADAPMPAYVNRASVKVLVECGILEELPFRHYRVHGLASEREKRSHAARIANAVRWDSERTPKGVPSRAEQRQDEQSQAEQSERPDVEAFLGTRFRLPTPNQRTFMDTYCQVFDQTGPDRAAQLIWSHPDDPIGALKADLTEFREGRREEAIRSEVPKPRREKGSGMSRVGDEIAKLYLAPTNGNGEPVPLAELAATPVGYHAGGTPVPKPGRKS
ncbi:MAG TPA: hypothetical protein VII01_03995 [Solirubrobacteraceae bacterium]